MGRYRKLIFEITARCEICELIEEYIKSQIKEVGHLKKLLSSNDAAATRCFIEDEICDVEMRIETARRVIEGIMSSSNGDVDEDW